MTRAIWHPPKVLRTAFHVSIIKFFVVVLITSTSWPICTILNAFWRGSITMVDDEILECMFRWRGEHGSRAPFSCLRYIQSWNSIGNNGSNTSLMSQTSIHLVIAASRTALLRHLVLRSYHFRLQKWEFRESNGNEIIFERRGYREKLSRTQSV